MNLYASRRRRTLLLRQIAALRGLSSNAQVSTRIGLLVENFLQNSLVQRVAMTELLADTPGSNECAIWSLQNLAAPTAERRYDRLRQPIEWFFKRKESGGFRKVCDLPVGTKLFHVLARDILTTVHVPRMHIGDWPGRGRDWLVQRLAEKLSQTPNQFVIVTDIRSCFASINPDALYRLPHLSERFVRIVLDSRSQRFVQRGEDCMDRRLRSLCSSKREATPCGLLEGSPASNAILAILLNDLDDQFEREVSVFVYCDNIVLVAPTEEMARRAGRSLRRYVATGRLGCLSLHQDGACIRPVTEPFEFLGYSFRVRNDGYLRIGLSDKNYSKFLDRLDDFEHDPQTVLDRELASFPAISNDIRGHLRQHVADELGWRGTQA